MYNLFIAKVKPKIIKSVKKYFSSEADAQPGAAGRLWEGRVVGVESYQFHVQCFGKLQLAYR